MIVKIVGALLSLIAVGTSLSMRRCGFSLNGETPGERYAV
jgi:hypothetical protein